MTSSLLSLEDIIESTGGIHLLGTGDFSFTDVTTDSRSVGKGSLFIPLIGENQDGHLYIPQAVEKGASVVFISLSNYEKDSDYFVKISLANPKVFFIGVENTLYALQAAAECYVAKFPTLIKVGITGSSGKTTTKEIVVSLLSQKYSVIANKGNFNSETGLPLSVFNIRNEHRVGVFEMGMNRENEILEISKVLKPRFGLVTNIGTAHIGILGSRENIAKEKAHVFDHINRFGTGVVPKDDDFADYLASQIDGNVVYYGDGLPSNVEFVEDKGLLGSVFKIDGKTVSLPLPGKYNYKDALGAIALAQALSLTTDEIVAGFESLKPLFGRSEVLSNPDTGVTVVQDCYNANPDSMEKAIELMGSDESCKNHYLVLGDMLELGEESLESHRKTILFALEQHSFVIFVGKEMKSAFDSLIAEGKIASDESLAVCFGDGSDETVKDCISLLNKKIKGGDAVLVKGSRGMRLERVVAGLLNKD